MMDKRKSGERKKSCSWKTLQLSVKKIKTAGQFNPMEIISLEKCRKI
jgi:hypothetical protein